LDIQGIINGAAISESKMADSPSMKDDSGVK